MKTKGEIEFEILDTTAIEDSSVSAQNNNIQSYSNLSEIVEEDVNRKKYVTFEKNFSVLDGSLNLIDENDNTGLGYSSLSMSNSNGELTTNSVLIFEFEGYHTSPGITLEFAGDSYSTDFTVQYYKNNTLIYENDYSADSLFYYCEEASIEEYNKIIITFREMSNGYRYVKISRIYFGCIKIFGEDLLISANATHEIDLLSSELNIGKLSFKVSNSDRKFSLLNPEGIYSSLQDKQKIRAYEYLDNDRVLLGTFYLSSWKNTSEQVANFEGQDAIGLMDTSTFYGGMYADILSQDLINIILTDANIEYELDEVLENIHLSGYIPKCSHREALQQVLFVIGAIAKTSGSEILQIYVPQTNYVSSTISKNRKHTKKNEVSIYNIVTGVDVTYFGYQLANSSTEVYKEVLDEGVQILELREPVGVDSITVTGATIVSKGVNYVKVNVAQDNTTVIVNARVYEESKNTIQLRKERTTEAENNVIVKNATLINKTNAKTVGKRILDFYEDKYKIEFQFKSKGEETGDCVSIESLYESRVFGNIQKTNIDMTGGAIVKCVAIGVLLRAYTEFNSCGEFYCNDSFYREMI